MKKRNLVGFMVGPGLKQFFSEMEIFCHTDAI